MADPMIQPPVQDVPPKGGYPPYRTGRILGNRGPPAAVIWAGFFLICGGGLAYMARKNRVISEQRRQEREEMVQITKLLKTKEIQEDGQKRKAYIEQASDYIKKTDNVLLGLSLNEAYPAPYVPFQAFKKKNN